MSKRPLDPSCCFQTAMEESTPVPPPDGSHPLHGVNGGIEETEESNIEEVKAPLQLKMEFLRALKDKELQLACQLCQIILVYEPDNPEASEFLPLIKNKLLKEQGAEDSSEGESNGEDDPGSSEESQSSSTSPSSDDDDDDDENGV